MKRIAGFILILIMLAGSGWMYHRMGESSRVLLSNVLSLDKSSVSVLSNERDVIDAHLVALQKLNFKEAYDHVSKSFKRSASLREFIRFARHYDALIRHQSFTITTVGSGQTGSQKQVEGLLMKPSGQQSIAIFDLVNEDGKWKIDNIDVKPMLVSSDNSISKLVFSLQKQRKLELSEKFDNITSFYEINYPDNWDYKTINQGAVVFTGKPGSLSYFSTVNVQTILTKKSGGNFSTVPELVASIMNKVEESSRDVRVINEGPIDIKGKGGEDLQGYFVELTYEYSGREYQQWQVVIKREDDRAFYTWAFTSPKRTYLYDLPTAQAMFKTWVIY